MQIDWITVLAQLINFLVLVWLLNRFLFRPVLAVMASREALIDQQLQEAAKRMLDADAIQEEHRVAIKSLEASKQTLLADATTKAQLEENRLLEKARREIDKRRDAWLESLQDEKQEMDDAFRQSIAQTTRSVTDALLRRISSRSLTEQMIESFIDQIDALDSSAKALLGTHQGVITIVSAEHLGSAERRALTRAVHEEFQISSDIDYQVDEQLIAGLKLSIDGFELDWHLSDMLKTLDKELSQVVETANFDAR